MESIGAMDILPLQQWSVDLDVMI